MDSVVEDDATATAASPTADDGSKSTKRQLLSCTSCRKRKVKCDRVHPCQACCGRGHPKECVFLTKEKEDYEPIAQSYEIRKLRAENERLKMRLRLTRKAVDLPENNDETSSEGKEPPRVPAKPKRLQQKRFKKSDLNDNLYFGSPGLASVVADFANMQVNSSIPSSVTYSLPRGEDIFAYQDAPCYPFGTFWRADGLGPAPVQCLPPRDELFGYLDSFQKRAQSCSFPHVPEEITRIEVERFLDKEHENAVKHPAMLALIFAALAQGLQNGVYDKSGGEWVEGAMEAESWKGDMYIAAAMQCLRMASFMNRPTLLCIQTLIMIGPYLTNAGRFLDAWALFGVTIRLAQSIGLHRTPKYLDPAPPLRECGLRQVLWWWMLHMDQQYSMTLGRPLGISGIGDCPPPEPLTTNPTIVRLSEHINMFTIQARQILSSDNLTTQKIDEYTDKLLDLRDTLPDIVQFDETWNDLNKPIPDWPLDAIAAVFYGKTHNFLILLNRQRQQLESPGDASGSPNRALYSQPSRPRGRERVLSSARSLLAAFEFFHTRVRPAMICWTMGQQAFNASMILALSLLHPKQSSPVAADAAKNDYTLICKAWATFQEMDHKGIHKLAGVASNKIYALIAQLHLPASATQHSYTPPISSSDTEDTVMGNTGMLLLEDPGLQAFVPEPFEPLRFNMVGGQLAPQGIGIASPTWSARPAPAAPAPGESATHAHDSTLYQAHQNPGALEGLGLDDAHRLVHGEQNMRAPELSFHHYDWTNPQARRSSSAGRPTRSGSGPSRRNSQPGGQQDNLPPVATKPEAVSMGSGSWS